MGVSGQLAYCPAVNTRECTLYLLIWALCSVERLLCALEWRLVLAAVTGGAAQGQRPVLLSACPVWLEMNILSTVQVSGDWVLVLQLLPQCWQAHLMIDILPRESWVL